MAKSYSIGPNPKWYFVNKNGKPLSGGLFNTYSSLNNNLRKNVFSTPSADFPLPNPANIDADGTLGPFWFEFDTLNPDDGYLIEVTDANGNMIWTADHYFATGSGGSSVTVGLNLENLVKNNVLYHHVDDITTPLPTFTVIAPSNHDAFVANTVNAGTNPSPDICFIKDSAVGTDQIYFSQFSPLGTEPITDDTAPVDYINYQCTVPDPTQTIKCLQFPINAKVQNLSGQSIIGSLWMIANGATPNQQVVVNLLQYFGDGAGASVPVVTTLDTFTILVNNTWDKQQFAGTIPSVTGKTLGAPDNQGPNDGLFLQIQFSGDPPVNVCDIGITKPTLYLGNALPELDFQSYDDINTIISSPRTGDVRLSLNSFAPFGWVFCNDGVLAKTSTLLSPVTPPAGISIARYNYDTYGLYVLLWNIFQANPAYSAIYTSAGVVTVIGADPISDFSAGKQLLLTRTLGRALSSAGNASDVTAGVVFPFPTSFNVGQNNIGAQTKTLAPNDLPLHSHQANPTPGVSAFYNTGAGVSLAAGADFTASLNGTTANNVTTNDPFGLFQPTSFWNVFLKL